MHCGSMVRPSLGFIRNAPSHRQAKKTLTKEAKRVRSFLLQQAIRKDKSSAERRKIKHRDQNPARGKARDRQSDDDDVGGEGLREEGGKCLSDGNAAHKGSIGDGDVENSSETETPPQKAGQAPPHAAGSPSAETELLKVGIHHGEEASDTPPIAATCVWERPCMNRCS